MLPTLVIANCFQLFALTLALLVGELISLYFKSLRSTTNIQNIPRIYKQFVIKMQFYIDRLFKVIVS